MQENHKKQIVFVESDAMDMQAKIAKQFRDRGYKTILVTITKSSSKSSFILGGYDQIISFNFKFFRISLKNLPKIGFHLLIKFRSVMQALISMARLNPYVVIVRGPPNWFCIFIKNFFKKYPTVYYPYDIRSHSYETLDSAKKEGVKMFEIRAERDCFKTMDGIIHKGNFNELNILNTAVLGPIKISCPTYHFLPYTLKELTVPINMDKLSKKDKQLHIAYAGCILGDKTFVEDVEEILRQRIHLHIYAKHSPLTREEWLNTIGKDYKKFKANPYYHMHDELGQKELIKEISKYDYAIWLGFHDTKKKTVMLGMGNKFSTYLEAGLPLIHFQSHKYIWDLTKKYKTGIGITFDQLKNLGAILKKTDYPELIRNIRKTRQELELANYIPEMENFFKDVIKYKENK